MQNSFLIVFMCHLACLTFSGDLKEGNKLFLDLFSTKGALILNAQLHEFLHKYLVMEPPPR